MGIKVYQLAKELGLTSKELILKLKELKLDIKSHMSLLDGETAEIVRHELSAQLKVQESAQKALEEEKRKELKVKIPLSVKDLSVKLGIKPSQLIKTLIGKNVFATINQMLPEEIIISVSKEFGYRIEKLPTIEEALIKSHEDEGKTSKLVPRAPVVTLMGHVDHGKTSILDFIRKTKITEKEFGGITQHMGAYEVILSKGKVTFLDTPGHEAFTAMRARGANVTDVVVLVVAADDGIMPQTIEAIDHAKAANVPIVVAVNKCDLKNINIDKVKRQLSELGLTPEDWGGKTITVNVSARTGEGIDNLLEMLLLEAELLELRADLQKPARGIVIESHISEGKGPVATVLVQNGTFRVGDIIICGLHYGKVRALINDRGRRVKESYPSDPVEVLGLSGVTQAGDLFYVVSDEKKAKEISLQRQQLKERKSLEPLRRITLEDFYSQVKEKKISELNLIIKSDVVGSIEALLGSLDKLSTKDITLRIIHKGVGDINESDIMLAAASNAIVIGFHVDIDVRAKAAVELEGVDVRLYKIIYEVVDNIKAAMEGLLEPYIEEVMLGKAKVRQVFRVSKVGVIAGCLITEGKITKDAIAKLTRGGEILFKGKISSLKKFKEDVKEVTSGSECGIGLSGNWSNIEADDIIETFEIKKTLRKL